MKPINLVILISATFFSLTSCKMKTGSHEQTQTQKDAAEKLTRSFEERKSNSTSTQSGYGQDNNSSDQTNQSGVKQDNNEGLDPGDLEYSKGLDALEADRYANAEAYFKMGIQAYERANILSDNYAASFYFTAFAESKLDKRQEACNNLDRFRSFYRAHPDLHTVFVEKVHTKVGQLEDTYCEGP